VWVPAGLWLIQTGHMGWGIFVLAWGMFAVSTIDNVIKPLIISRGVDLPFVLVLLGVLGGVIAFGFIGVFLGPVLLAVGYALLMEWAAMRGTVAETRTVAPTDPQAALSEPAAAPAAERARDRTAAARNAEAEETARD
jgi:predicted PurR-regulated permease PerM